MYKDNGFDNFTVIAKAEYDSEPAIELRKVGKEYDNGISKSSNAIFNILENSLRYGSYDSSTNTDRGTKEENGGLSSDESRSNGNTNNERTGGNTSGAVEPDIEVDSTGKELSSGQSSYFKDSKARLDDGEWFYGDGNLAQVYHATSAEQFYTFKRGKLGTTTQGNASDEYYAATALIGFWFNTQDLSKHKKFPSNRSEKVYLNITNPFEVGSLEQLTVEMADHTSGHTSKTIGKEFVRWLRNNEYDGIILHDEEFGGMSFVTLNSNQVKLTTNLNPTGKRDIRYSLIPESDDRLNDYIESVGKANDSDVSFSLDDDTEGLTHERSKEIRDTWFKDHVLLSKTPPKKLFGRLYETIKNNATRTFANIPEGGEQGKFFAEFRKDMIQWKNLGNTFTKKYQRRTNNENHRSQTYVSRKERIQNRTSHRLSRRCGFRAFSDEGQNGA